MTASDNAQARPRARRRDNGDEYFGQAKVSETDAICACAIEKGLTGAIALGIWAAMIAHAGKRARLEGDAAPSISRLAKSLGIDRSTVQRYLSVIESTGLLAIERASGRKPTWMIRPSVGAEGNLPLRAAGQSGEVGEVETAGGAAQGGNPCRSRRHPLPRRTAPAPAREKEREKEEKVVGGKLRKIGHEKEAPEALAGLVQQVASRVAELLANDPDSPEAAALEKMAFKVGDDCDRWKRLVDLAALRAKGEEVRI